MTSSIAMVVHHFTFLSLLFCIFLLLLSTCDASSLPHPHLFKVGWPPAFGRAGFTWLTIYRENEHPREAQQAFAEANRRSVFQGKAPFTKAPPPPEWLLLSWLPGNYSEEPVTSTTEQTLQLLQRDFHVDDWLEAAVIAKNDRQNWKTAISNVYKRRWNMATRYCGLQYAGVYFTLGADFLRRHLPLGQWLAEAGITPNDRLPYSRLLVEMALAARLGGVVSTLDTAEGRHFRLYCVDMNEANRRHKYESERERRIVKKANITHELNNMLYSVVVCVDSSWQGLAEEEEEGGASEAVRFVPCPPWEGQTAGLAPVKGVEVPCQGSYLYYFRTLDDGIELPFMGKREEPPRVRPAHEQAHIFGTVWPPAYARLFTGINAYRVRNRERREEWLPFVRANLLNNGQPHLLPWMLRLWLPANYDAAPGRVGRDVGQYFNMERDDLMIIDNWHQFGEHCWLYVAANRVRDPTTRRTLYLLHPEGMLRVWRQVGDFHCDQFRMSPAEYFDLGATFLRLHLPVGQWLEEEGITPNDTHPYHRKIIETTLALRLGGGIRAGDRHFILYCADMNVAEVRYTPPEAERYIEENHPSPDMIISVVVCVDRNSWNAGPNRKAQKGQPPEEIRFAPCPSEAPFYKGDELYKICRRDWLYYYRTLNDGIDGPFLEELPVEQQRTPGCNCL